MKTLLLFLLVTAAYAGRLQPTFDASIFVTPSRVGVRPHAYGKCDSSDGLHRHVKNPDGTRDSASFAPLW